MARYKTRQLSNFPYHITSRTPNRCPFPLTLIRVWEIMSEQLYWVQKKYGFDIISFVLMPNHFHLIARTVSTPLGKILNDLLRDTSKKINEESGRINQNWGGVAYRTEVTNMSYYFNVYRYVYQNPLRARLVSKAEDYPYSTLHGKLGRSYLLIPVIEDSTLFDGDLSNNLNWLNQNQSAQDIDWLRHGLRYKEFRLKKDTNQRILLSPDAPPTGK